MERTSIIGIVLYLFSFILQAFMFVPFGLMSLQLSENREIQNDLMNAYSQGIFNIFLSVYVLLLLPTIINLFSLASLVKLHKKYKWLLFIQPSLLAGFIFSFINPFAGILVASFGYIHLIIYIKLCKCLGLENAIA